MQTSFELAVALASVPRGACRILRVESTPVDGTTRRVDGVCAEAFAEICDGVLDGADLLRGDPAFAAIYNMLERPGGRGAGRGAGRGRGGRGAGRGAGGGPSSAITLT